MKTLCLATKVGFAAWFSRVLKNAKTSPQAMKMTCFRYGFERYPLSLPKFNLDDRRGVFAIIYPHKFPQSVYFCRQAQHLRSIRSQRVSFETVLKTRYFHRQVRCFRVFQDPKKAHRETYFCRQTQCFSSFDLLFCPRRGSILSTGAVVSAHSVTRDWVRKRNFARGSQKPPKNMLFN